MFRTTFAKLENGQQFKLFGMSSTVWKKTTNEKLYNATDGKSKQRFHNGMTVYSYSNPVVLAGEIE